MNNVSVFVLLLLLAIAVYGALWGAFLRKPRCARCKHATRWHEPLTGGRCLHCACDGVR